MRLLDKVGFKYLILIFLMGCGLFEDEGEPVEIDFEIVTSSIEAPSTISIENNTKGATTYNWTFPNAVPLTSDLENPEGIIYSESGLQEVTLEASNGDNMEVLTKEFFLGPVDNGLVAYYPFNGNENDLSGFNNHGVVNGASLTSDRNNNSDAAYFFDGVDDFIEVVADERLAASRYELSISLWLKINSFTGDVNTPVVFLDKLMTDGNSSGWELTYQFRTLDPIERRFMGSAYVPPSNPNEGGRFEIVGFDSETLPQTNEWYHLVFTFDQRAEGKSEMHINGELQSSVGQGGNEDEFSENLASLFIGRNANGNVYFSGVVDDIRIYDRVLDSLEIQYLNRTTD
ncbi:MAG: LamG domain-containing protein [Bacteroidota bacterium]